MLGLQLESKVSVLCVQCIKRIHDRCASVKMVIKDEKGDFKK